MIVKKKGFICQTMLGAPTFLLNRHLTCNAIYKNTLRHTVFSLILQCLRRRVKSRSHVFRELIASCRCACVRRLPLLGCSKPSSVSFFLSNLILVCVLSILIIFKTRVVIFIVVLIIF